MGEQDFDVNSFLKKAFSNFDSTDVRRPGCSTQDPQQQHGSRRSSADHHRNAPRTKDDSHYHKNRRPRKRNRSEEPLARHEEQQQLKGFLLPEHPPQQMYYGIPQSPSKASLVSGTSTLRPSCRICQIPGDNNEELISPCRCSGTMQYVHTACLVHWLEISTKKMHPSPRCELCNYEYQTHQCFTVESLQWPACTSRDRALHFVFILVFIVMLGCAALSIMYLQADRGQRLRTRLSVDDVAVITCSLLFFCAFFVAVFTQYRAEASLCRLFFRCWLINKHWRIKNYDRNQDPQAVVIQQQPRPRQIT